MKLLNILFIFLSTSYGFIQLSTVKTNIHRTLSTNNLLFKNEDNKIINNKSKNFLKLIRYKNILPTFLLSLTGGLLINPSKIITPVFIVSVINTILIMSSSMVLNDIFDINIDLFLKNIFYYYIFTI
jgi:heme O synthase-like polyprenyltransferase